MVDTYNITLPLTQEIRLPLRITKALWGNNAPTAELSRTECQPRQDKYQTRPFVMTPAERNELIRAYHNQRGLDYSTRKLEKPVSKSQKLLRRVGQWFAEKF